MDDIRYLYIYASTTLGNYHSFRKETEAIGNLILSRGRLCKLSPKGHPEIARAGINMIGVFPKKYFVKITNMFRNIVNVMYARHWKILD